MNTNPIASSLSDSLTAGQLLAENAALRARLEEAEAKLTEWVGAQLREGERRLRALVDNLPGVVLYQIEGDTSGNRRFTYISAAVHTVLGLSREEVLSDARAVYAQILPEYLPGLLAAEENSVRNNGTFSYEFQIRMRSGEIRWITLNASVCMKPDGSGAGDGILVDITARKKAEEEIVRLNQTLEQRVLERTAELRKAEAQLHQSQKLEATGLLAGGIAHDFNNLLGVILGYGESILDQLHESDPLHTEVGEIMNAGRRAAALTRQLLAFSRKQTLQPEAVNLNDVVRHIGKMLHRLIGEDISIRTSLAGDLGQVMADTGQIEQVIMNLVVNARDAMQQGGTLNIETANVEFDEDYVRRHGDAQKGPHVSLAVSDTGCGMDVATLDRIFEPFFTTKDKSKGTGLGLATVYGIIKQSGGTIDVSSEPGRGTTFRIHLPRLVTNEAQLGKNTVANAACGQGELILMVEDDPHLRKLLQRRLVGLGYTVRSAANGGEALLTVEKQGLRPDLLLTDVIMPGMSGTLLAERLARTQPGLKVLYMSGYTDDALGSHGVLGPGIRLIGKPFHTADLANMLRTVLEEPARDS